MEVLEQPDPDVLVLMGHVMRGHGIKGEVKVFPETDDPIRFEELDTVYLGRDEFRTTPYRLEKCRFQNHAKKGVIGIIKFASVDDRSGADELRGNSVFARQQDLPLDEDEIFLHDLIGLTVQDPDEDVIGRVKDVMRTPAHDVYVVEREGHSDALVPDVDEFIIALDLDERILQIDPIDGLLE